MTEASRPDPDQDPRNPHEQAEPPVESIDDITEQGWKDVFVGVRAEVVADHVPLLSAGVAFYSMLAIFPALIATISIYSLVANPDEVTSQLRSITRAMPPDAAQLIVNQAHSIASSSRHGLGIGVAVGIVAATWSASTGMRWLMAALTLACEEHETRSYLRQRGLSLLLTLAVVVMLAATFGLTAGLPALFRVAGLGGAGKLVANILRWPVLAALLLAGLSGLYRFGPDRGDARWRSATWGSCIGAGIWLLGSAAFLVYSHLAHRFDKTYGTMAGVIALMLWLFLAAFAIILGAEIDTQLERQLHDERQLDGGGEQQVPPRKHALDGRDLAQMVTTIYQRRGQVMVGTYGTNPLQVVALAKIEAADLAALSPAQVGQG